MRRSAVLIALVLSLVGCGGSDGQADETATTTTAPTTSESTTTTSAPVTTTEEASGDDALSAVNCPEFVAWASDAAAATQAAFGGGGTNADGLAFSADYFQAFADRAPDEIRDDMQVFADAFREFFAALDELDIDFTDPSSMAALDAAAIEKLEAATAMMDTAEVRQAGENIEKFFERECS